MKNLSLFIVSTVFFLSFFACSGNKENRKAGDTAVNDTVDNTPDSIVRYFSNQKVLKEVSFKNGVRNGLTKTFYVGGQLYQTFLYKNDLREDSSGWYYTEGQLFRSTPYLHDTIHGIQRQYYRDGKIRARIGYDKGLRTEFFQEFTKDGKLVKGYPEITITATDNYKKKGQYILTLGFSDNSKNVRFYNGEIIEGKYDTTRYKSIKTIDGKGTLVLKKTGIEGKNYIGIVGDVTTNLGNRYLTYKKVDLPYNDLQ